MLTLMPVPMPMRRALRAHATRGRQLVRVRVHAGVVGGPARALEVLARGDGEHGCAVPAPVRDEEGVRRSEGREGQEEGARGGGVRGGVGACVVAVEEDDVGVRDELRGEGRGGA